MLLSFAGISIATLVAPLIANGTWGQSRITEFIFGDITHHRFQQSNLPMLLEHWTGIGNA